MAYLPQSVLVQEQKCFGQFHLTVKYVFTLFTLLLGTVSISTQLVGYYHGLLLLRDLDADLLVDKMLSTELLNTHEQDLILSGYSVHQRNWQLLEHVRHLDTESLLKFSKLVQDIWPQIELQLVTGKVQLYGTKCVCTFMTMQKFKYWSNVHLLCIHEIYLSIIFTSSKVSQ